jgi:hypothetical protein
VQVADQNLQTDGWFPAVEQGANLLDRELDQGVMLGRACSLDLSEHPQKPKPG